MRARLFWLLSGLTVWSFAGYPLLLLALARVRGRPHHSASCTPRVSVIVAAHDEQAVIASKLDSVLDQDYPRDALEVIVASDGSTDATEAIVKSYADSGVRLLRLPRGGKAAALNAAAEAAEGEILAFSDANAILASGALRALVAPFADREVGGVSANEQRDPETVRSGAGVGERIYWEYDKRVKLAESALGSIVSASGSLYAIRRELFVPISDPSATDDFAISTQVVRAGYRLVFAPDAVTWEPAIASGDREFGRRVRIVTRGLRSVWGVRELLLPWRSGFYSVQLWSHKVLRRLVGFAVAGVTLLTALQAHERRFRALLAIEAVCYGLALAGWRLQGSPAGRRPWFSLPYYFVLSNLATSLGVIQFLRGRRVSVWQPRRED